MKKKLKNIVNSITIFTSIIFMAFFAFMITFALTSCNCYVREITKLYFIEEYKIHDNGVEIWAISESKEKLGIFVVHENIYSCEEDVSRVVCTYNKYSNDDHLYPNDQYLYFSEEDFKEYIKDRYDIE